MYLLHLLKQRFSQQTVPNSNIRNEARVLELLVLVELLAEVLPGLLPRVLREVLCGVLPGVLPGVLL